MSIFKYLTVIIFLGIGAANGQTKKKASAISVISGHLKNAWANDTIILQVWDTFISEEKRNTTLKREMAKATQNGNFSFKIGHLQQPLYCSISIKNSKRKTNHNEMIPCMELFLLERGTKSYLEISSPTIQKEVPANGFITWNSPVINMVSGSLANEWGLRKQLDSLSNQYSKWTALSVNKNISSPDSFIAVSSLDIIRKQLDHFRKWLEAELAVLKEYESKFSKQVYGLLKTDLIGWQKMKLLKGLQLRYADSRLNKLPDTIRIRIIRELQAFYVTYVKDDNFSGNIRSKNFLNYLLLKNDMDVTLLNQRDSLYFRLKENYTTPLRDYLVTKLLLERFKVIHNKEQLVTDALSFVSEPQLKNILTELLNNNAKGSLAFNFSLQDMNGKTVKMENLKGKIVLLDFWFTGCGGCRQFYQEVLTKAQKHFSDDSLVVFVSVSIDTDKMAWVKSIENNIYTTVAPTIVNLYTNGKGVDHPVIRYYHISSYPSTLLIGKDGKIFCSDESLLRDPEGLKKTIEDALRNP